MSISPFLRPSDLSLERSYLATPLSPEILSVRDARSFENEFFRIRLSNDSLILHSTGNRSGFSEMNSLRQESRRQSNDPTQRKAELFSAEGSLVHNIGISAEIIVNFGGKKYLLSIHQDRQHTVGDEVVKLISGFTDWRGFPQTGQTSGGEPFFSSLLSELREEILPLCPDCALPIKIRSSKFMSLAGEVRISTQEGSVPIEYDENGLVALPAAYPHHFAYAKDKALELRFSGVPSVLPSVSPVSCIRIGATRFEARFMIDQTCGSAQLIFPFELDIPKGLLLSLTHAEETPVTQGDVEKGIVNSVDPGTLKTVYRPKGLILLELDSRNCLTGEAFHLLEGCLIPVFLRQSTLLSEAFVPNENGTGIVVSQNIPLREATVSEQ